MARNIRNLSKQIFLNSLACPTFGWLMRSGELDKRTTELTLGERFRMEQGLEIGKIARTLDPNGILVDDYNPESGAERTSHLLSDRDVSTVFEATFIVDRFVAKADVLRRRKNSWQMVEVKSSVNDKPEFIDDMAYTFMVLSRSGVPISKASLQLVSRDYRLGMSIEKLFVEIDHTDEVQERSALFESFRVQIEEATRSPLKPAPDLRFECRACAIFGECLGKDTENHIFEIPRLSQPKFVTLKELGVSHIEDIPDNFPLTENQMRVRNCVQKQEIFVSDELKRELESIKWPSYYLDFETVMTALPLYPDIAPYTQLPTQYSIHKCSAPGQVIIQSEYLSDPSRDSRRELAEQLVEDLGQEGSIITYSNFERTILNALSRTYTDLSTELGSDIDRIVDIGGIIAKHYYHPSFHGSTSVKTTLPVCVPELSYDDLEIGDGDSAVATFAYLARGKIQGAQADSAKHNLLEYCKRDTLAMVKLHQYLVENCVK